jgi:hypothetical protein
VRVVLPTLEAMQWDDIDSIEVIGVAAGWQVTPRTRCQPAGPVTASLALGATVGKLCGATPALENLLDIQFSAESDASLPAAGSPTISVRLNHRREGWHTFTYNIPAPVSVAAAAADVTVVTGAITQPTTTIITTTVTSPVIDITKVRRP